MFTKRLGWLITMALLIAPCGAFADGVLAFQILAPGAGAVSYIAANEGGAPNPLVGTGIVVDEVVRLEPSKADDKTLNIIGGLLSFTTGPFTGTNHPTKTVTTTTKTCDAHGKNCVTTTKSQIVALPPTEWDFGGPTKGNPASITITAQCVATALDSDTKCDLADLHGPVKITNVTRTATTVTTKVVVTQQGKPTKTTVSASTTTNTQCLETIDQSPATACSLTRLTGSGVTTSLVTSDGGTTTTTTATGTGKNRITITTTKTTTIKTTTQSEITFLPFTLMAGTWEDATVTNFGKKLSLVSGNFDATLNLDLANIYGIKTLPEQFDVEGFVDLIFLSRTGPPASFIGSQVFSGTVQTQLTPEPASLPLTATGVIYVARLVRRRRFS